MIFDDYCPEPRFLEEAHQQDLVDRDRAARIEAAENPGDWGIAAESYNARMVARADAIEAAVATFAAEEPARLQARIDAARAARKAKEDAR